MELEGGKIARIESTRLVLRSCFLWFQCKFYHSLWRKQVYRLLNTHIEASLPYTRIEAKDSLHFLKDCKNIGEVEIVFFTTLSYKLIKAFEQLLSHGTFLLCLHNNLMYIMPYQWNIK